MPRGEPVQAGNGGAQTEKLAWFIDRTTLPVQRDVDGLSYVLGVISTAIPLGLEQLVTYYRQHLIPHPQAVSSLERTVAQDSASLGEDEGRNKLDWFIRFNEILYWLSRTREPIAAAETYGYRAFRRSSRE
jgi:hypothetical protein